MKLEAAAEGKWSGGPQPVRLGGIPSAPGEDRKFAGLRIRETEAAAPPPGRRRRPVAAQSLNAIARAWNAAGSTGTLGGQWTASTGRAGVLLRPRNAGIRVHLGAEVGPGTWPAILDEPVFRAVCRPSWATPAGTSPPAPSGAGSAPGFYQCGDLPRNL